MSLRHWRFMLRSRDSTHHKFKQDGRLETSLGGEGLSLMNITGPGKVYMSPLPIITCTQ